MLDLRSLYSFRSRTFPTSRFFVWRPKAHVRLGLLTSEHPLVAGGARRVERLAHHLDIRTAWHCAHRRYDIASRSYHQSRLTLIVCRRNQQPSPRASQISTDVARSLALNLAIRSSPTSEAAGSLIDRYVSVDQWMRLKSLTSTQTCCRQDKPHVNIKTAVKNAHLR